MEGKIIITITVTVIIMYKISDAQCSCSPSNDQCPAKCIQPPANFHSNLSTEHDTAWSGISFWSAVPAVSLQFLYPQSTPLSGDMRS